MHPDTLTIIRLALAEDIGSGDITAQTCVPADRLATGYFLAREHMVLAGTEVLPVIYPEGLEVLHQDGDHLREGDRIATVRAGARTLLECERVTLNFLQRLSGVATLAHRFARMVEGTKCRVLDTRKTTPGLRRLEKAAAACGGVTNHRMGLFDAILIKNNHITLAGGIKAAVEGVQAAGTDLPIEVEVRTRGEIEEALALGVTRLLLDNMTPAQAAVEIQFIDGRASVELSGGITLTTIREFAETGADFISTGAITHSATAVDINLRVHAA
jgi:nicotinate-nucleotide pyrophosphorylase (carboxylating)